MHWNCQRQLMPTCPISAVVSAIYMYRGKCPVLESRRERVFHPTGGAFCPYFVRFRVVVFTAEEIVPSALWAVWWQVKTQVLLLRL